MVFRAHLWFRASLYPGLLLRLSKWQYFFWLLLAQGLGLRVEGSFLLLLISALGNIVVLGAAEVSLRTVA